MTSLAQSRPSRNVYHSCRQSEGLLLRLWETYSKLFRHVQYRWIFSAAMPVPPVFETFSKNCWQDHHVWGMRGYHLRVPISKARFHWQDQVPICDRGMSQNKDWYDWFSWLPCGRNFTGDLGWCPTWYPAVFNPPSFSLLMNNWTVSEPPTPL